MKKSSERLLDAISSLKRAAHIENLRDMPDHFNEGFCFAFAGSQESADLLQNILAQALSQGEAPIKSRQLPGQAVGGQLKQNTNEDWGIFEVSFPASQATNNALAERIENYTKNLIAPDHVKRSR